MTTSTQTPNTLSDDFWVGLFAPVIFGATLVMLAPLILLRAWVISMLWGWYVVPAFDAAPLRLVFAFGLSLLATYLIANSAKKDERKLSRILVEATLKALFFLLFGWVGTWFI